MGLIIECIGLYIKKKPCTIYQVQGPHLLYLNRAVSLRKENPTLAALALACVGLSVSVRTKATRREVTEQVGSFHCIRLGKEVLGTENMDTFWIRCSCSSNTNKSSHHFFKEYTDLLMQKGCASMVCIISRTESGF